MPLPVAHGLFGASVFAALRPSNELGGWKWLAFGAFLGIAPDFDFALNWLLLAVISVRQVVTNVRNSKPSKINDCS